MALNDIQESLMRDRVETFRAKSHAGMLREFELLAIAIEAHRSGYPHVVLDHMERVHDGLHKLIAMAAAFDPDEEGR